MNSSHLVHLFPRSRSKLMLSLDKLKRKQTMKLLRNLDSIIETKLDYSQFTYENCITILREHHPLSVEETKVVSYFLSKSETTTFLKKRYQLDQENINKLYATWTGFLFLKEFEEDTKIISIEEEAEKVFVLLSGEVEVLYPKKVICPMNAYEYFSHIVKLFNEVNDMTYSTEKRNRMRLVLDLTLKENFVMFPIDKDSIHKIQLIVFDMFYRRMDNKNSNEDIYFSKIHIENSLSNAFLSLSDFDIKCDFDINNITEILQQIDRKVSHISSEELYSYSYLIDKSKSYNVYVFDFISKVKSVQRGDEGYLIGGSTNEGCYEETVVTKSHCVLMALPYEIYHQYLDIERENMMKKEIFILANSSLFKGVVNIQMFKKLFFPKIEVNEYQRGNIILSDTQCDIDDIFFIKEGEVELTFIDRGNANELVSYLESKVTQHFNKKMLIKHFCSPNGSFESKTIKLLDLKVNDFYGVSLMYYKMHNHFNLVVSTEHVKVYRIKRGNFISLLREEKQIRENVKKISEQKIKCIISILKNANRINEKMNLFSIDFASSKRNQKANSTCKYKAIHHSKNTQSEIVGNFDKRLPRTKKSLKTVFNSEKLRLDKPHHPISTKNVNSFNTLSVSSTRNYKNHIISHPNCKSLCSPLKPLRKFPVLKSSIKSPNNQSCYSFEDNLLKKLRRMSLKHKYLPIQISEFSKIPKQVSFLTQLSNLSNEGREACNQITPVKINSFSKGTTVNERLIRYSKKKKSASNSNNNISIFVSTDTESKENEDYYYKGEKLVKTDRFAYKKLCEYGIYQNIKSSIKYTKKKTNINSN